MKYFMTTAAGLIGALLTATSANAAVVCNAKGDCWRVKEAHTYPDNARLEVYNDKWQSTPARAAAIGATASGSTSSRLPRLTVEEARREPRLFCAWGRRVAAT